MSLLSALTSTPPGFLRNNFGSDVGFYFQTNKTIYIRSLGRWVFSGNSGTHTLKLWQGSSTVIASVSIDTTQFSSGAFGYIALATPIKLLAATDYYCTSLESNGGDNWNDQFTYTLSGDISSISASFNSGGMAAVAGGQSYVPTNFLYSLTPGGQTSQILG